MILDTLLMLLLRICSKGNQILQPRTKYLNKNKMLYIHIFLLEFILTFLLLMRMRIPFYCQRKWHIWILSLAIFLLYPNSLFLNAKMFSDAMTLSRWGPNREHPAVFTIRSAFHNCDKMTGSGTSWSMAYITDLLTSTAEISNMVSILSVLIGLVVMSVFLIRLIYQV